jgi:hypothetical protein
MFSPKSMSNLGRLTVCISYIKAKDQGSNVKNGLHTSQNKAVNLSGSIATSADIVG